MVPLAVNGYLKYFLYIMRLRKKNIARTFRLIVLCVPLLFSMVLPMSCSKGKKDADDGSIKILASFYPLYIMLMNITEGIQGVSISMLAPPDTGCLHDYQLTTKDMRSIEDADIFVVNGLGMEDFLDKVLEDNGASGKMVVASGGYGSLSGGSLINGNPHLWVSVDGAVYQVLEIANGLSTLDPGHSDLYMENASSYVAKLLDLSIKMHAGLDDFAGKRIVTFHEAFPYFAREFGLNLAAVIEREPGEDPSARELDELVSLIKDLRSGGGSVALFAEPQYSSSAAEVIAAETGLKVWELDPCVTGEIAGDAYIRAMEKNLEVLEAALR